MILLSSSLTFHSTNNETFSEIGCTMKTHEASLVKGRSVLLPQRYSISCPGNSLNVASESNSTTSHLPVLCSPLRWMSEETPLPEKMTIQTNMHRSSPCNGMVTSDDACLTVLPPVLFFEQMLSSKVEPCHILQIRSLRGIAKYLLKAIIYIASPTNPPVCVLLPAPTSVCEMSSTPTPSATSGDIVPLGDASSSITWSRSPTPLPRDVDDGDVHTDSPLWASLLRVVQGPHALSPDLISSIADENNPRPLRSLMRDGAEYWVKSSGDILHVTFPAKLDRTGQYERIGPYFNLPSTGLDIAALQKVRAQFELVPLDEHDTQCPADAIKSSGDTLQLLFALFNEVESTRQKQDAVQNKQPSVIPFWRTYEPGSGDHYALVVSTDVLFHRLPKASRMSAPKLTRADIGKSNVLLSPSKARAAPQIHKAQTSNVSQRSQGARISEIHHLPDPDGRYAGLLNAHPDLAESQVVSPDIRDRQGILITPGEYDSRFMHEDYVEVEVFLKLWNIQPTTRSNNQNGSRIYQMILKSMKLLPYHSYTQAKLLKAISPSKGKRRPEDDDDTFSQSSPTKKPLLLGDEKEMDFEVV